MIPACDHTGTPRHFHSSTMSGSASLMRLRSWPSILPRQSPSSLILASIRRDGDSLLRGSLFSIPVSPPSRMIPKVCRVFPRDERGCVCAEIKLNLISLQLVPRQKLLQIGKDALPPAYRALIILLLIRPETRLLHPQVGSRPLG